MTMRLIVDSQEFMRGLRVDIASAKRRVFAQAMTIEGDSSGLGLARLVRASRAPDRRIAVDEFARYILSSKLVHDPRHLFDRALHQEARDSRRMVRELRAEGVGVKFTNPIGFLGLRAAARNHKKLVIVDDRVAYIGGFNFTEHNFSWRDVMLRMDDPDIVAALADDFECTWRGENRGGTHAFPGITLHVFDGRRNGAIFAPLFRILDQARESIDVHCCFLTPPFTGKLRAARDRGVRVRVILPANNVWKDVTHHAEWELGGDGIELLFYRPRMTHLKTMLVDDRTLVVGSANFDFLSYRFHQEFMAIVTDPSVVADYRRRVLEPDLRLATPRRAGRRSLAGMFGYLKIKLFALLAALIRPSIAEPEPSLEPAQVSAELPRAA